MSDNYRFYTAKMEELRVCRETNRPLHSQLQELFVFVKDCEAQWDTHVLHAKDDSGSGD